MTSSAEIENVSSQRGQQQRCLPRRGGEGGRKKKSKMGEQNSSLSFGKKKEKKEKKEKKAELELQRVWLLTRRF